MRPWISSSFSLNQSWCLWDTGQGNPLLKSEWCIWRLPSFYLDPLICAQIDVNGYRYHWMLASCCIVSVWRHRVSLALSCLASPCMLNAQVEFADNKSVIWPTVCATHSLRHSDPVCPSFALHYGIVNEMPVFGARRGCIHDVFLRVVRRKTVLIISNSYCAHFLKRRRPLLLYFPTPSAPITPSQVWWSVPSLALKSPRRMSCLSRVLQTLQVRWPCPFSNETISLVWLTSKC